MTACQSNPDPQKKLSEARDLAETTVAESTSLAEKEEKIQARPEMSTAENNALTLVDIFKKLQKKPELFEIDPLRDTLLIGAEGTKIRIPANAFVAEKDGKPAKAKIQIRLREYYQLPDLLLARLSTSSNGELLETGGTIHIEANAAGDAYRLAAGKTLEYAFPYKTEKKNMQLFNGTWTADGTINWTLEKSPVNPASKVYSFSEKMPAFPGGNSALSLFLSKNAKYPEKARAEGLSGKVFVEFVVLEDGTISNPTVIRSSNPIFDQSALGAVRKLQKFDPGMQGGKAVAVKMTIPVVYRIDGGTIISIPNNDSLLQKENTQNIRDYVLRGATLGWINCDRFLKNAVVGPMTVQLPNEKARDMTVDLVLHNYRACVGGTVLKNGFFYNRVPKGEPASLVLTKKDATGLYYAVVAIKTASSINPSIDFKPVTVDGLIAVMKELSSRSNLAQVW
jgi:TonB family protein